MIEKELSKELLFGGVSVSVSLWFTVGHLEIVFSRSDLVAQHLGKFLSLFGFSLYKSGISGKISQILALSDTVFRQIGSSLGTQLCMENHLL